MPSSKKLRILYVTTEVFPFCKAGGLAEVSAALPQKIMEMGHDVRVIVPKYGNVDEKKHKIHEVVRLKDLSVNIGDKEVVFSLRSSFIVGTRARVQIYFLDNDEYFGKRHSLFTDPITGEDFEDNDERFILLSKAVFELITKLGWYPDIIHCNDWQCGLIPAYLRAFTANNPLFSKIKSLFTIHNLAVQGSFPFESFAKTNLPDEYNNDFTGVISKGRLNFMKSALNFSDSINTVSEKYAEEICNDQNFSDGLFQILNSKKDKISGIINGIDENIWNPECDKFISKQYSLKNPESKVENKITLSDKFNLDYSEDIPLIGIISKLIDSKGFDILTEAFEELMKMDIKLILLGSGDKKYHSFFEDAMYNYQDKFSCYLGNDEELAHLIAAGADIYLMPSLFEPCGLNQMYSLIYGTVPVVRATGGLADTVQDFNYEDHTGNGIVFSDYSSEALIEAVRRAVSIYRDDKNSWQKLVKSGMKANFNWNCSSKSYVSLYKEIIVD